MVRKGYTAEQIIKIVSANGSASPDTSGRTTAKRLKVVCGANTSYLEDSAWVGDKTPLTLCEVRVSPNNTVKPNIGALELFAREGAKLLLTIALEEEVTAALKRRPYERSQGKVRGYRNGHRERQVSCGAGDIEIPVPRVSDTEETFRSQLLKA